MDVGQLAHMIRELIPVKDEISLPGMGVFVVEEVPAAFSDKGYTINPPYLRLAFRQKESADDSLVKLYAKTKSISEKEASTILGGFFKRLASVLRDRKSVALPGLGRLRSTNENIFFFVQNEDIDIYPQGFGLDSISLKTLTVADDVELLPELEEIPGQAGDDGAQAGHDGRKAGDDGGKAGDDGGKAGGAETAAPAGRTEMRPAGRAWRIALWSALAAVLLFFALLAILGRVAPQLVDPLLYNPQELQLLNSLL